MSIFILTFSNPKPVQLTLECLNETFNLMLKKPSKSNTNPLPLNICPVEEYHLIAIHL